jgi:uncharacterized protein (DUF697 family)/tellurite resistance protein
MTPDQQRAILNLALLAARADGHEDDRERAALRALAAQLPGPGSDLATSGSDLSRVVAPLLADPALARSAYEVAVAVADADGAHTAAEGVFLERLASALNLPAAQAKTVVDQADDIANAAGMAAGGTAGAAAGAASAMPAPASVDVAALDKRILDASVTNAALELLPETLASMAILPLQMRLVYKIGEAYGYKLDQGHIKEMLATVGVGMAGQYLEQIGRRVLGGLLGSVLGGMGRSIGRQAASSGMAFATTWAIGQLAKQYYGGGRTLDAAKLKAAFAPLVEQGQGLVQKYAPAIEERARSIDIAKLPQMIRGL